MSIVRGPSAEAVEIWVQNASAPTTGLLGRKLHLQKLKEAQNRIRVVNNKSSGQNQRSFRWRQKLDRSQIRSGQTHDVGNYEEAQSAEFRKSLTAV